MYIIIKKETNNFSLVAALHPPLPPIPSKTPPLPPPPVLTPVPTIVTATGGMLAAAFLDLSTKVQLNNIFNRKWKFPIYHSDANSLEGIDNWSDIPNAHVSSMVAALSNSSDAPLDDLKLELYYSANMIVLGKHWFVLELFSKFCTVNLFNYCLEFIKDLPIVDAAIAYDFPYSHECYILLFCNALYSPNIEDNLLPPFIMCERGAAVHDSLKIHCTDTTSNDHCITLSYSDLKIPFHINGTFSFFHTRRPTADELHSCEKILITPDRQHWNTYCKSY